MSGRTGGSYMNIEYLSLVSSLTQPALFLAASILMYTLIRQWPMRGGGGQSKIVTVGDTEAAAAAAVAQSGGFAFFDIADEHKALFTDALNGFSDFAKLKGYSVELSFDTTLPGKVGIRFTILDSGITVSTAKVRKDVDEYINRLRSADDLSDMPMATDSTEHVRLTSAIQARFAYLRTQAEMFAVQVEFYKRMMHEWKPDSVRGIGYVSPVQIHLTNEGSRNMRDSYNAENSRNIAQGKKAKAVTKDSTIAIGSTLSEKNKQVSALKDLEKSIGDAELPDETRQKTLRHVQNAVEEMENSSNPDPDEVGKWLGRADTALKTAGAAAGLMEKLHGALEMFGLAGGTPTT